MNTKPIKLPKEIIDAVNMGQGKDHKRKVTCGISWDADNFDYIDKMRGGLERSEYVNGIITAIRQYHEESRKK